MRYIAFDVHKGYCEAAEISDGGKLRHFRFPNTREAWVRLSGELSPDTKVVLEATGSAHWIYDLISPYAGEVLLSNPMKTRAIAEARIKTDKIDAEILVRLLRSDFIPGVWVGTKRERELRTLLGHRVKLVRLRTALKNAVHAVMSRNGYVSPASDLFGKKGREFLQSMKLPGAEEIVLRSCLTLISEFDKEIKALEGEVYARAREMDRVKLLLKVPGLDVISVMTILSEIGDISRFPSPKELCSYAGLVPRVHFSGKTRYTGSITRAGRSNLRWIMVQVAHQAVKVPGRLQRFYLRLKTKKGTKVAIVAVARKLLSIIWTLLIRNEEYREPSVRYDAKLRKMDRLARPYSEVRDGEVNAPLTKPLQKETNSTEVGADWACAFS